MSGVAPHKSRINSFVSNLLHGSSACCSLCLCSIASAVQNDPLTKHNLTTLVFVSVSCVGFHLFLFYTKCWELLYGIHLNSSSVGCRSLQAVLAVSSALLASYGSKMMQRVSKGSKIALCFWFNSNALGVCRLGISCKALLILSHTTRCISIWHSLFSGPLHSSLVPDDASPSGATCGQNFRLVCCFLYPSCNLTLRKHTLRTACMLPFALDLF